MKVYGAELNGPLIIEKLSTLSEFSSASDIARLVYVEDEEKIYYGKETEWSEVGSGSGGTLVPNIITSTPTNLTAEQCLSYAHYVTNDADTIVNLPAVSAVVDGAYLVIYMRTAHLLTVNPDDADRILLNGTALTDGYKIVSDGSVGNYVTLHKDSADGWAIIGRSGYWSSGGA